MTGQDRASDVLGRDSASLAASWRARCVETSPGSPPAPSVARAYVAAVADAIRLPDPASDEATRLLHSPLEFDHDASVSVEQMAAFRGVLHRHLMTELPATEAMSAVEVLGRLADSLLVAVTERAFRRLEAAAFLDPLTGVGNRRALDRDATPLLATAQRHSRPLSVIVIDLDFLKRVNDSEGHAAGDEAIRRLASTLSRHLRSGDAIYRVGGDEFVLVLPETRPDAVGPLLQRAIGQAPPFSYGVAGFPGDGLGLEQLIDAADQELLEHRRRTRGDDAGRLPRPPSAPTTTREAQPPVRRIASMPWPEREIEERLYEIPDVLAARVNDEEGGLHIGVLVRPTTDTDGLSEAILAGIEAAAGAVPEVVDLRVMPLGSTAEARMLRPAGGQRSARAAEPHAASAAGAVPTVQPAASVPEQLVTPPATDGRSTRTVLVKVTAVQEGAAFAVEVELRQGERSVVSRASGLATRRGTHRLVAEATANGLNDLDGSAQRRRGIEWVDILTSSSGEVAVVGVEVVDQSTDEVVTGSAAVRGSGQLDAIVRAVLDATNRTG